MLKNKIVKEINNIPKENSGNIISLLKNEVKILRERINEGASTGQFAEVVERMEKIIG